MCTSVLVAFALLGLVLPATASAASRLEVGAWLIYWDHERGQRSVTGNPGTFTELSPFWFQLSRTGGISRFEHAEDPLVIAAMRTTGVALLPTITNSFDRARVHRVLRSPGSRARHVADLVDLVVAGGYAGIDVDYENLDPADRDRFTSFVELLAERLHANGKVLRMTLQAKTYDTFAPWSTAAQDWVAIGAAADRVRIMAYDYHWSGGPPGAIAPVWWVDRVATYAATAVQPGKVQLALGLYGRDWPLRGRASATTWEQARALARSKRAKVRWSRADATPYFRYGPKRRRHTVWFENARSVRAKVEVARAHDLAGVVFWRLGGEDPRVWRDLAGAAAG